MITIGPAGTFAAPASDTPPSSALIRRLRVIARGRAAQFAEPLTMATIVLDGMLEKRGLVRTVKHRDHTRSYALTDAGRAALKAVSK